MYPLDEPCFSLRQAAEAVDLPVDTVRFWFRGGHATFDPADKLAPTGATTHVSLRTVFRLAIMAELKRVGMSPGDAFAAAVNFADFEEMRAQDLGDATASVDLRPPGELFSDGHTLLVVWPHGAGGVQSAECIKVSDADAILEKLVFRTNGGRPWQTTAIVVHCNSVVYRVAAKLGVKI